MTSQTKSLVHQSEKYQQKYLKKETRKETSEGTHVGCPGRSQLVMIMVMTIYCLQVMMTRNDDLHERTLFSIHQSNLKQYIFLASISFFLAARIIMMMIKVAIIVKYYIDTPTVSVVFNNTFYKLFIVQYIFLKIK